MPQQKRKTFAQYHGCYTTGGALTQIAFLSFFAGIGGTIMGSLSTNFMGDEGSQGAVVEQQALDDYNKAFTDIERMETRIATLKRVADAARADMDLGIRVDEAAERLAKATATIETAEKNFSATFDSLSRRIVTDTRISESNYDDLVLAFERAATTPLPQYMTSLNGDRKPVPTAFDSSLRECQAKFAGAPEKAKDIVACTIARTNDFNFDYGFVVPAAMTLFGMLGAPFLQRRRREEEPAEEKSNTQTLKVTYTTPKK